jgi:hypothetical protein
MIEALRPGVQIRPAKFSIFNLGRITFREFDPERVLFENALEDPPLQRTDQLRPPVGVDDELHLDSS